MSACAARRIDWANCWKASCHKQSSMAVVGGRWPSNGMLANLISRTPILPAGTSPCGEAELVTLHVDADAAK